MKRKMLKQAAGFILNTVNGLNTKTGTIYLKDLVEYVPNADGYNEQLAEAVYDVIRDNLALWDQGSWRKIFDAEAEDEYVSDSLRNRGLSLDDLQRELTVMAAFKQDLNEPACGTAMCFAGWTVELKGVDWVVDAKAIKAFGRDERYRLESWEESIMVPLNAPDDSAYDWSSGMPDPLLEILKKRGFSHTTHSLTSVPTYAMQLLNPPYDHESDEEPDLFSGDKDLEDIRSILDEWAEVSRERSAELEKADAGA